MTWAATVSYWGMDGRPLRWQRLFKASHLAHLARLSVADNAALAGLGITRALDFDGLDERAAMTHTLCPTPRPGSPRP